MTLNLLEPESLANAFLTEPPEGFEIVSIDVDGKTLCGFIAELDLFTTADGKVKRFYEKHKGLLPDFIQKLLKPKVLFIGTTVTEYALFPYSINTDSMRERLISKLHDSGLQFLIIKDVPSMSPLLSEKENEFSSGVLTQLRDNGFFVLYGQALSYVPIDFSSTDEYMNRLSRSRRKDLRRKLRSISDITIDQLKAGDEFFTEKNIDTLYGLYLNVYNRSDIHFDKLTRPFFKKIFEDKTGSGIVFLYRHHEKIIGFNLCFLFRGCLVDKYVGFLYPDSHDFNLYFVSWFYNLDFCVRNNLKTFIAGWTDPEIKSYLGATFTYTSHAVYIKNPALRFVLGRFKSVFESDKHVLEGIKK